MKRLTGISASSGIVIEKAFIYPGNELSEIKRHAIPKENVKHELFRLKTAFFATREELKTIHEQALGEIGKEQADIFAAHIMMNEDPEIRDQIIERIKTNLENAEWAVFEVARTLTQAIMASPDPAFQERAADINDVSKRILCHLLGIEKTPLDELGSDHILVAHDLLPSEILTMDRDHVKGIVTDLGGSTSHTAILARAFNIPAVLGLVTATREIANEDVLVVDGSKGEVLINPGNTELEDYQKVLKKNQIKKIELDKLLCLPAETLDGFRVNLEANIETVEETETALLDGAEGIGLYRTEFLFLRSKKAIDEERQVEAYSTALKTMGDKPVTIRTIDIGGDKILPGFSIVGEKNPLLGLRAIRFSLARPELFKIQLRAILRSSVNGKARIMFPLVSGLEELEQALAIFEEAKDECRKKAQAYDTNIETGVMIEIPSAVMIADILAAKSNFFSIGTNDLVQYTLAADRENEQVSYLAQPCHPAVFRFIKMTIDAAHKKGIKAAMCGEMAGDPVFTPLLLGFGLDEFSMTSSSIPMVKKIIRESTMENCKKFAEQILRGVSATENLLLLKSWKNH